MRVSWGREVCILHSLYVGPVRGSLFIDIYIVDFAFEFYGSTLERS